MFVADEIQENYKNWRLGDIILIHAQTGAGKTYFVLNVLLPYIASQGKRLLYLSNRSALRDQINLSYSQEYAANITVKNYQSFERVNLSRKTPSDPGSEILSCEYWVMDEAHYFLVDGRFNSNVISCMRKIKSERKNRILIFMTATPEYMLLSLGQIGLLSEKPPSFEFETSGIYHKLTYGCKGPLKNANLISQLSSLETLMKYKEATDNDRKKYDNYLVALEAYEKNPGIWSYEDQLRENFPYKNIVARDQFYRKFCTYQDYLSSAKSELIYYGSTSKYTSGRPIYFKNLDQLIQRISDTPEHEKWLIFASSKRKCEEIKTRLSAKYISSVVITAETKLHKIAQAEQQPEDYEVYQNIIQNEYSPARVTISTAVLDNGVNLKDLQLKHIVILEMNPTTFVQMLGRKRTSPGEKIYLYLQAKDLGEIKGYFRRTILQYVRFIAELKLVNFAANYPEKKDDQLVRINLEIFENSYQESGSFRSPYCHYVQQGRDPETPTSRTYLCRYFEPNPMMTAQLSYDYYRMLALLESYENTPEDDRGAKKETLWIEHQLSWLGLEYDRKCWIDYPEYVQSKETVNRIINRPIGSVLSKKEQDKLKSAAITMVKSSHPPMAVKIGKGSLKKINEALAELGYSQKIVSRNRSIKGKRRNYWIITDGTVPSK